jgi:hypothetical protein
MDVPRFRMQTEGRHSFSSQDGYDDVTTADLQELLRLGRETVLSLEAELARRNTSASNTLPSAVKACLEKLQSTMYTLSIVQRLEDPSNLAYAAAETLKNEQKNRKEKVYKQFLTDIQQQCGGGVVVLCSSSLGKRRIVELKNSERMFWLGYLKSNCNSFKHAILDNLAVSHGIMTAPHEATPASDNTGTSTYPISVERRKSCIIFISRPLTVYMQKLNTSTPKHLLMQSAC